jgi:hypothetical protein
MMNGTTFEIMLRLHSGLAQLPNTTLQQALSHRDAENAEKLKNKTRIFCESSFHALIQHSRNPLPVFGTPSEAKRLIHTGPRFFASGEAEAPSPTSYPPRCGGALGKAKTTVDLFACIVM